MLGQPIKIGDQAAFAKPAVRVAFFLPHMRHGGVERIVMLLLTHLDRSRFTPMLILQRSEGEYLAMLDDDVEVVTLRSPRPPGCVVELFRILRTRRVDVIYTATNAANIYATMAAALPGSRVRAVIGEHTPLAINLAEAKRPVLRRAAMRWSYQRAALAVAPLEEIGTELRDLLGASCPPFRCLPNPVVTALAPPRPLPRHARRIVSVGRLATVKRFDLLIEAFAAFHRNAPDASLVILGDGPERAALETLALELGVAGAVSLPGYVEDVAAHLESADLFVCSSRREGFGNAIVEALAAGVPVVSVDCPFGPAILLRGGSAGRLVREPDPEALAAAIEEVAGDRDLRCRYATSGREVASAFTVARSIGAYSEAFLGVLDQDRQELSCL